ncbi:MAG: glycosyl transferase [Paracoccaceae bacterium]
MAQIAFILLCHKDPDAVIKQAERLTAVGDYMAIHFDASADPKAYRKIRAALDGNPNVTFAKKRIKCGWGEWSLVDASLQAVKAAVDAFPRATHFYMLSGDCMAIKSARYAHDFLDEAELDYIESYDFFGSNWIKTGMKEDRLIYRHFFNERTHKRLFYTSYELQKRFGFQRQIPADLQIMIGSQWWCLRRRTVEWILDFCRDRPDVMRFFRTTWIPDETFFQTLVRHLVPGDEISNRSLTFLMFSDYGMPVTFYNDHYDLLLSQEFLFARKISPDAMDLKRRLGDLYASDRTDFRTSNEGITLFKFLTGRGRIGRRFAPRFWERQSTIGRERELLVLACKKWHVAKRLLARVVGETGLRGVEYLFDEENTRLPDLGGIESTLGKRTRHRRALLRLIYDHYQTNRLVICLDPSNIELLQDLFSDGSNARLLEIECHYKDDYLMGHAKRVGLAGEMTPQETIDRLLPTVRHNFVYEADQIRAAEFPNHFRISEDATDDENAAALAGFLGIEAPLARDILSIDYLFVD